MFGARRVIPAADDRRWLSPAAFGAHELLKGRLLPHGLQSDLRVEERAVAQSFGEGSLHHRALDGILRRRRHRVEICDRSLLHLRQTEVQHLHPSVGGHEDVLWLEVTVDDPRRMRRCEAVGDVGCGLRGLARRQRTAAEPVTQRLALQELGDDKLHPLVLRELEDAQDVGMGQLGERLGLPFEPRESLGVVRDIARQHLDRHLPLEPLVQGTVHLAHSTGAKG